MKQAVRIEIHQKYNGRCAYCGKVLEYKDMQVDHILPKYNGGTDDRENLNPSCRSCNYYKSTQWLESFRKDIETLRERNKKIFINKVAVDYGIIEYHEWDGLFYFERIGREV